MNIGHPLRNLTIYNDTVDLANEYEPKARMIFITATVFCSLLIVIVSFLLYKTSKINQKNFYLLILSFFILGCASAIAATSNINE